MPPHVTVLLSFFAAALLFGFFDSLGALGATLRAAGWQIDSVDDAGVPTAGSPAGGPVWHRLRR